MVFFVGGFDEESIYGRIFEFGIPSSGSLLLNYSCQIKQKMSMAAPFEPTVLIFGRCSEEIGHQLERDPGGRASINLAGMRPNR